MIAKNHPVLDALEALPWECHLIGSRYVGKHFDSSDYDFLLVCKVEAGRNAYSEEQGAIKASLTGAGFLCESTCSGYGPDPLLEGIWRWAARDKFAQVDVLVAGPVEAARRLAFFRAQKAAGNDDGGKLALMLKQSSMWPTLWKVLKRMESERKP